MMGIDLQTFFVIPCCARERFRQATLLTVDLLIIPEMKTKF